MDKKQPRFFREFLAGRNARQEKYSVGNRVYNGSSPSPHAGKGGVDLGGYATRDNMARVKQQRLSEFLKTGI